MQSAGCQSPVANPTVSVVIPLYNKAHHVRRSVESVLAQTVGDFELIVVDDGSTDGGGDVVKTIHDPRVRLIHQTNAGVSSARNHGIREARADLVAFLDADDEWHPELLATILRLRQRHPECGAYGAARNVVEKDGRRWTPGCRGVPPSPWEGVIPNYFRFPDEYPVHSSGVAIPRYVFEAVGTFLEGVAFFEDTELWARIALRFPIAFCSRPLSTYRKDAENRMCDGPIPLEHPITALIERALESGELPAGVPLDDIVEYKNKRHIYCAFNCVRAGFPAKAREHLRAAASTRRYRREWRSCYLRSFVPPFFFRLAGKRRRTRRPADTGSDAHAVK
jgi:glycosyltransferase involved in cell wall biosynthesis